MLFSDRLQHHRGRGFVGRAAELDRLLAATSPGAAGSVWWVHGPGGVGKSSLLRELERRAAAAGAAVASVDLAAVDPSRPAVDAALTVAVPRADGRRVLLVDTLEAVAHLEAWLREVWLPDAPGDLVVVLAGRDAPGPAWTADPGWADLLQTLALGPLSEAEGRALLAGRGVDAAGHADALAFARGHPLALALAAESLARTPDATFADGPTPDVVGALVQRFLSRSASAELREAVEACAVVRAATEPLLAELLERPVPSALFDELAGLPIAEPRAGGVALHALAREAVLADLRWRAPERADALHARARRAYTERLQAAPTPDAQRDVLADYASLYRDAPVAGPLLAQLERVMQTGLRLDAARPADVPALVAAVERHEGPGAAALARHWLAAQPEAAQVVRDATGAVVGALVGLRLDRTTPAERAADPLAAAVHDALGRAAPRPGEAVLLFRVWLDVEVHQGVSAVQALLFAQTVWAYLATPRLAASFLACAAPTPWADVLAFAGMHPWPAGEVEAGGVRYAVFGHDWRAEPPGAWLDALAGRPPGAPAPPPASEPVVALGREAFGAAVRDALRLVARPGQLLGTPLLDARVVRERLLAAGADLADDRARTDALAALLREATDEIAAARRGEAHAAALRAAFFRPAPSQEIAAERLGVPYSTFRRHLARGVEAVTDVLWAWDVGGFLGRASGEEP